MKPIQPEAFYVLVFFNYFVGFLFFAWSFGAELPTPFVVFMFALGGVLAVVDVLAIKAVNKRGLG